MLFANRHLNPNTLTDAAVLEKGITNTLYRLFLLLLLKIPLATRKFCLYFTSYFY